MVRHRLKLGLCVGLALMGARGASAASSKPLVTFTGNVAKDMPVGVGVNVVVDNPLPTPLNSTALPQSDPNDVAIADWMAKEGRNTGFNFREMRLAYDQANDTMYVGVRFFGVAGDVDGDGDPNKSDARTIAAGGIDEKNFGGREAIAVGFDINRDKIPDIVAGIPTDKSKAGPGIDGFTVSKYVNNKLPLSYNFGDPLNEHSGGLAFEPTKEKPDFEFSIKKWSKLPGYNPLNTSFGVMAYAGSIDDVVIGEDMIQYTAVSAQTIVPEPASVLGWTVLAAGGAFWAARRRRRQA